MDSLARKARQGEVARTGRIPSGSEVHTGHMRNPNMWMISAYIQSVQGQLADGTCDPAWGRKRLAALEKMRDKKFRVIEKRRK